MHVATHQQRPESVAGLGRERRRRIKAKSHFRRIDAKQANATHLPKVDGVAVEDTPYGEMVRGSGCARRERESGHQHEPGQRWSTHAIASANRGPDTPPLRAAASRGHRAGIACLSMLPVTFPATRAWPHAAKTARPVQFAWIRSGSPVVARAGWERRRSGAGATVLVQVPVSMNAMASASDASAASPS